MTREEVIKQIINPPISGISAYPKFAEALNMALESLLIDRLSGKWIDVNGDGSLWRCDHCKDTACCNGNFCPNCGAKMVERG